MSRRSSARLRPPGCRTSATTTQAELLVGLGTETLLREVQEDPATSLEAYLELRSSLMRLLDPSAMGRFRVMAFGRDWPDGPPLDGLSFRAPRSPTSPNGCRLTRAIYLLPLDVGDAHASRRSGTT